MPDFKFEILKSYGALSKSESGWQKELTIVSWNDRKPKYDIRNWSPQKERMGRGITLTKEELLSLKNILDQIFANQDPSHLSQIPR